MVWWILVSPLLVAIAALFASAMTFPSGDVSRWVNTRYCLYCVMVSSCLGNAPYYNYIKNFARLPPWVWLLHRLSYWRIQALITEMVV